MSEQKEELIHFAIPKKFIDSELEAQQECICVNRAMCCGTDKPDKCETNLMKYQTPDPTKEANGLQK